MSQPPDDPNATPPQPGPNGEETPPPQGQTPMHEPNPHGDALPNEGHPHAPGHGGPPHPQMPPHMGQMPPHGPQMPPLKPKSKALPIVLIVVGCVAAMCLLVSIVGIGAGVLVWNQSGHDTKAGNGPDQTIGADTDVDLTYGDGDHHVDYYYDFACPPCGDSMQEIGPLLRDGIDEGKITVTMHPVAIVNRGDSYGVEAGSASVCAADVGEPEFFDFTLAAMEQVPKESESPPSNAELADFVDLGPEFVECVNNVPYAQHMEKSTQEALDGGLSQVPSVRFDDQELAQNDTAEQLKDLIENA